MWSGVVGRSCSLCTHTLNKSFFSKCSLGKLPINTIKYKESENWSNFQELYLIEGLRDFKIKSRMLPIIIIESCNHFREKNCTNPYIQSCTILHIPHHPSQKNDPEVENKSYKKKKKPESQFPPKSLYFSHSINFNIKEWESRKYYQTPYFYISLGLTCNSMHPAALIGVNESQITCF